jgi:hypothetical protein
LVAVVTLPVVEVATRAAFVVLPGTSETAFGTWFWSLRAALPDDSSLVVRVALPVAFGVAVG